MLSEANGAFEVGGKTIGAGHPTYFVAEIGNNHNGDVYLAKRLIEESAAAGADAVKLQKRSVSHVFTKELRETPQTKDLVYGKTYGEYREKLELPREDFLKLKDVAKSLRVTFFATPFDHRSVDFLESVGVDVYKIASFDMTNLPLLDYVARKKKPMFVSTGMSTPAEIDMAVATIKEHHTKLALLHCVSVYPTPDDKLNLRFMEALQERYAPIPVGYSGHEQDILPSLTAITLGASVIERHITLDKRMPGPDHATVSIEPDEFGAMVAGARRIHSFFGTGVRELLPEERRVRDKHGKSVVSAVNVAAGTVLTAEMLDCKSPGYGFPPRMLRELVGRVAARDIAADTTLSEKDLRPLSQR